VYKNYNPGHTFVSLFKVKTFTLSEQNYLNVPKVCINFTKQHTQIDSKHCC